MNTNTAVAKVAEGHTQTSLDPRRPVRALVGEARALHELERAGESGWTPLSRSLVSSSSSSSSCSSPPSRRLPITYSLEASGDAIPVAVASRDRGMN